MNKKNENENEYHLQKILYTEIEPIFHPSFYRAIFLIQCTGKIHYSIVFETYLHVGDSRTHTHTQSQIGVN